MSLQKRKTFKRGLSYALAIAIAFLCVAPATAQSVVVTAADFDYAGYVCAELDILRGDGSGVTNEYLSKESIRVQAAYLTLRLMGKETEAEAYRGTDNFNDVGHLFAGGQRRTAYLKANSSSLGWEGDGTNRLMPDDPLTAQQFYKVLLTVLGYEVFVDYDYADTLDFAEDEANMFECRYISGPLTNDDIAVMLVEALMATMKGESYTLAEFLAEEGVIDYQRAVDLEVIKKAAPTPEPPPVDEVPATLQHKEIAASNFAEIDVVFNQAIDKTSIDRNYIRFDDKALEETDVVRVLEDGVTLRLYRPLGFVSSQGTVRELSISRIKTPAGKEMAAINSQEVSFIDNQSPSLVSVEAMGLRYVKLLFSEPLRVSDANVKNYTNYKFNGKAINTSGQIECTGREVYMPLSQSLERGQNTLTIDRNRLYDLAGFPIYDVEDFAFTAEHDAMLPSVDAIDATREKIVITFNKEVRESVRLCWVDGTARRFAQDLEKDPYERNVITFYFTEGTYLPVSSVEIIIDNIVDMGGTAGAEFRQTVTPALDTTRPEIVEVISDTVNEIVLLFSKSVRVGNSNDGRFTLKNENNVTISLSVQAYTPPGAAIPDNRYIKLAGNIPAGKYTLTVVNVEDLSAQGNRSAEATLTITTLDKNPPEVTSVATRINESKVVITFDKALDWASASNIANYQYKAPGSGHVAMPSGTSVLLEADAKTVVIQFPAGGWVVSGNTVTQNAFVLYIASGSGEQIRLLDIEDTSGNKMGPTVINVPDSNEVAAKLTGDAYAVSRKQIIMKFTSGALPITAHASDFTLRTGSGYIPLRSMGYSDINTVRREITFTLADGHELNADGTYGPNNLAVSVSVVLPAQVQYTKTALGTPLVMESASAGVIDNIRPELFEAHRGNRPAQNSTLSPSLQHPAISTNQILVVFDKRVSFYDVNFAHQLTSLISATTESAPNVPLSPSSYNIEAFDNYLNPSVYETNVADVRMILVTFINNVPQDAVSITVGANVLWNGKHTPENQMVLNGSFSTPYLLMNP